MVNLIAILFSLFWTSPSGEINVAYNLELEAIVMSGFDSNEATSYYDVSVYFGEVPSNPDISKIIGIFECVDSQFFFKSKYGFSTGASYTVFIKSNSTVEQRFIVKVPEIKLKPSTYIKNVYPTSSKLPMNQLKFYIEFSAPMRLGDAFEHVRLYKLPEGKLESEAFLVTAEELWNPDNTRVTIFFDPGRIKRGVQPNLQLGLPLVEGNTYKLVIDKGWLDINDVKLIKGFEKTFDVISVDRQSPNPKKWKIDFPNTKNKSSLKIDFNEAMDFGLLHSAIGIVDETNTNVEGVVRLSESENKWMFTPKKQWTKGKYKMIINAWLEDLAGNNLNRKFDVNLNSENDKPKNIKEVIIPFEIN
ncbi:MAG: Ig-like domain-containing protein [Psychroserpens sp.]|uniref:Ig-like domain-containing protein n=1 Tax=Psychroserpens sp. TaxID=2020870 RepID=UPI003001C330